MKKILALVLALVMTLSLATISSGAAFSDADQITYTDAVNTMSALGVLGGYGDGTVRPQADVTRGAAAKMVAMVATGSNKTTIGYYAGTSSFADVPASHTFADAVAFCVARGIVAGYGDGTYGVGDNVKGWAIAKMVLVAMGYDAAAFGMEGAGSALNTITLASNLGLFAGMDASFSANAAASREECAQIVYNALTLEGKVATPVNNAGTVTYDGSDKCLLDNFGTYAIGEAVGDAFAYGTKAMNILKAVNVGMVVANQATGASYTAVCTDNDGVAEVNYNVETGLDMIGHMVAVSPVGVAKIDAYGASYFDIRSEEVVDLSSTVYVGYDYVASKDNFKAAFGTDVLAAGAAYRNFSNYAAGNASAAFDATTFAAAPGSYVLYDNEDADVYADVVAYLTSDYTLGRVTAYSAGTAAKNGALKVAGEAGYSWTLYTKTGETNTTAVSFYGDIAVGDVVAVEKTGDLYTVSEITVGATGTVSAVSTKLYKESITVDGKTYPVDTSTVGLGITALPGTATLSNALVNTKVDLYLDAYGYVVEIAAVDESVDAGLVYVVETFTASAQDKYTGATTTTYYVQAVDMAGNVVEFQTAGCAETHSHTASCQYGGAVKNSIMKVSTEYDYVLKATVAEFGTDVAAAKGYIGSNYDASASAAAAITAYSINFNGTTNYFADDVKFIFVEGAGSTLKVTVKDGVQPTAVAGIDYYATQIGTSANYSVNYVVVPGAFSGATVSTDVVWANEAAASTTSETYTKADGTTDKAYVHYVYINGVETKVLTSAATALVGFKSYQITADGLYQFSNYSTDVSAFDVVTNLYGTKLTTLAGGDLVNMEAKDAKIVDTWYAAQTDKTGLTEVTTLEELQNAVVSVVYSAKNGVDTIDMIYVVDQAHEDGLLVGASATYLEDVIGIDSADVAAIVANPDWVVIQYTRTAGNAGELTIKDADGNVVYEETSGLTTAGTKAFWVDPNGANAGTPGTLALSGSYTFEVEVNGIVAAAGSFLVG